MLNSVIFIGSDHRGYQLKTNLVKELKALGYSVQDMGDSEMNPEDDYPIFAGRVANAVIGAGDKAMGILLCGSGQGMAMTANRFKGIRAAIAWDKEQARISRNDDNSNILTIPADIYGNNTEKVIEVIEAWLKTPFESISRRVRRIQEMDNL